MLKIEDPCKLKQMKKTILSNSFFGYFFYTHSRNILFMNGAEYCPLRMNVITAPGGCYNNSFIQIDLVNADGTPMDN